MSRSRQSMSSLLECPICLGTFLDPRMLPCLHTLCHKCLDGHITHSGQSGQFVCPMCKHLLQIPANGADAFPKNFFMNRCIDVVIDTATGARSKEGQASASGNRQHRKQENECSNSEDLQCMQAEKFCLDCCEHYCENCSKVHGKSKATCSHVQVALDDLSDDMLRDAMSKSEAPRCPKHKDKVLELYCNTCQCGVCSVCCHIHHQSHTFREITEVDEDLKSELTQVMSNLQSLIDDSKHKAAMVSQSQQKVHSNTSSARDVTKNVFQKMKQLLDKKTKQIDLNICQISEDIEAKTNHQNKALTLHTVLLESMHTFVNDLLTRGTVHTRLASLPEVRNRTKELQGSPLASADGATDTEIPDIADLVAKPLDGLVMKQGVKLGGPDLAAGPIQTTCRLKQNVTKTVGAMALESEKPTNLPEVQKGTNMVTLDEPHKIYNSVPPPVFSINQNDLKLYEGIGAGNFGSVIRGVYRRAGQDIPVAVKTLTQDGLPNNESDLMKEARVMAGLQHRNIVQMMGVCRTESIMLLLELAPLGPLNKYLQRHSELQIEDVLDLMFQVAEGMAYLEEKNLIHRDLAARNVLLVNDHFAKISEFGMCRAQGLENEYEAPTIGKWRQKWYAPECIYYFKFNSKSDIWSYGVTLWEATSYGDRPYMGLKGQEILDQIENGQRLWKPEQCSQRIYNNIMIKCWIYENSERPSFRQIVELWRKYR